MRSRDDDWNGTLTYIRKDGNRYPTVPGHGVAIRSKRNRGDLLSGTLVPASPLSASLPEVTLVSGDFVSVWVLQNEDV